MACAATSFWYVSNGLLDDPEVPLLLLLLLLELEVAVVLVRSSWKVPAPMCFWRVAFTSAEPGTVVLNAQMIFWVVSELAWGLG